ncbi:hypothetical protein B566_EDAN014068 [Ephemera danica]|nr:hypothetical protein B566_EDAN014068 [Ephemera danica]
MGCSTSRLPGDLKLYYMPLSSPCRSVMLTAASLGIKLNLQPLDLMKQENLTPEFIKLNPQHCIPTLDDEGFVLWESRAICAYLVNMYGKDDSLYPRDPQKRAIVDARLDFDQGTLNTRLVEMFSGVFRGKLPTEEATKSFHDAMDTLEIFLTSKWVAGNEMTIADMCTVATITTAEAIGEDISRWKNISRWLKRAKKEMFEFKEANQDGIDQFKALFKTMKDKLQQPQVPQDKPAHEEIVEEIKTHVEVEHHDKH